MVRPVGTLLAAALLLGACSASDEDVVVTEQTNEWPTFSFAHEPLLFDIGTPTEQQLAIAREADVPFDAWFFTATLAPPGSSNTVGEVRVTDFIVGPDSYQDFEYVITDLDDPEQSYASVRETKTGACETPDADAVEVRSAQAGCVLGTTGDVIWVELDRTFTASVKSQDATTAEITAWLDSLTITQVGQTGSPYEMPFCSDDPSACGP